MIHSSLVRFTDTRFCRSYNHVIVFNSYLSYTNSTSTVLYSASFKHRKSRLFKGYCRKPGNNSPDGFSTETTAF
jgi:hypothetical protein